MAEQEACAELVRSTENAEPEAEETDAAGERGESLLLPLLQGLLDGERAGGGDRLLAGLGTGDADVVADVRRALRRLRAVLTDSTTERHPKREALLALIERLEDGLDASADRLDGCKRQRSTRRRARNLRHTVGVTREELEVARRLVDESDLDDLKSKSESQTPVSKSSIPSDMPDEKEAKEPTVNQDAVDGKKKPPPIAHSVSYDGTAVINREVVRRSEPANKDKTLRHSIANGVPEASQTQRESTKPPLHQQNHLPVHYPPQLQQQNRAFSQHQHDPQANHQYRLQPNRYQSPQQSHYTQQNQYQPQQQNHYMQQNQYQPEQQNHYQKQSQYQTHQQNQYHPQQHNQHQPQKQYQYQPPQQKQRLTQARRPSNENIKQHYPVSERNGSSVADSRHNNEMNGLPPPPPGTVTATKDDIFSRAPLYRPPPPGYNFASVQSDEETSRPLSRFNSLKRNRMKRANTIDIPKPLNFYRVESDTEDEGPRGNRNSVEGPMVPEFQPKTDNDRKFLAFIQKNNTENIPWSPAKAAATQGQNWNSCFGNIKNAFESQSQSQDRSRSSSSSSARNFWKAADDQSVNPAKTSYHGPRLSRKSVQDLQQMHATKSANTHPWSNEVNGDVVSASITVTGPNHTNGIVQTPAQPFIAKPIPVNQFSHAPMSAFKPPKKVTSPIAAPPHVWSPPSYERNISGERERMPHPQTLPINNSYVPSKPVLKSPTSAPWLATTTDRPKRVVNLAASKFENNNQKTQPSPPFVAGPPIFKPKTFVPFENQKPPSHPYQNYPVKTIPSQNNLAAPELVKKFDSTKHNYDEHSSLQKSQEIDAQKLQIEFYEKQVLENAKRKPPLNNHINQFTEDIIQPIAPQVYTVTNYTPAQVTTFMPLQQTPDIEKAKAHKVDYLPDVVLNEHNQFVNQFGHSPSLRKSDSMTKVNNTALRGGNQNVTNYPTSPPGLQNGEISPGQYLEPQYDSSLSPGEYDPTEYTTVTRVMRGPAPQQATIKSGVKTRNDDTFLGTAAKSLKGVLQKFSSPKHEVLSQIERKKKEQRALNGPSSGYQVPSPQPQPQRMENQQVYNQPANANVNRSFKVHSTPPPESKSITRPVPIIKYNNVPTSPPVQPPSDTDYDSRVRSNFHATSRDFVQSTDSLDMSSKPPSPAITKLKACSPHSVSSTPSPVALSKSESWHQIVQQQNTSNTSSPRASPRKVVTRAKSMHLLSVPKMFEGGIAQEQLSEKRKTVEAYFSGQSSHASPQSLSKSNSQHTLPDSNSPTPGSQSPRTKAPVSRTKTSEKRSFSLGRSRTMPTINDLKFLDESNADDAFENLLKETFS